jgi:hypothetical protein
MADAIKKINAKILTDGNIVMDTTKLGMQNEKNVTKIVFDIPEELNNYNKTIEFSFGEDNNVTDIIVNNEYLIDNNISCNLFISFQVVFTDAEGNEVFKTFLRECIFQPSINATEPPPTSEQVSEWNSLVTILNQKIEEVDLANSINITATKEDKTATITITKADGSQESFYIEDGKDGANGKDGVNGKDGLNGQNGKDGADGKDYILTEADKQEIAELTAPLVEGKEPNLTGYVKEAELESKVKTIGDKLYTTKEYVDTLIGDIEKELGGI